MTALHTLEQHAMIERATRRVADSCGSSLILWTSLAPALGRIIGDGGFETLFFRCLYQASIRYPWLAVDPRASRISVDHLAACLATREAAEAEQASTALLIDFIDTLNLLIGQLVTTRILLAAWGVLAVEDVPEQLK